MTNPSKIPNPKSSMLTDDQWFLLQPILPSPSPGCTPVLSRTQPPPVVPAGYYRLYPAALNRRGRPPIDERHILEAILYKICHAIPWYDLPGDFPSHQTVYRRYCQWQRIGLWKRLLQVLASCTSFFDLLFNPPMSCLDLLITDLPITNHPIRSSSFPIIFYSKINFYSKIPFPSSFC